MTDDELREYLAIPPQQWEQAITGMDDDAKLDLFDHLDKLIQTATAMRTYIKFRHKGVGGGDRGHKQAAKAANYKLFFVRKLLGYERPGDARIDF